MLVAIFADGIPPASGGTSCLTTTAELDRNADTVLPVVREARWELDVILQQEGSPARRRLDRQRAREVPRQSPAIAQRRNGRPVAGWISRAMAANARERERTKAKGDNGWQDAERGQNDVCVSGPGGDLQRAVVVGGRAVDATE
jgi:hypothetical protein